MSDYIITTHDEPDVDGSYRLTKPAEEIVRCRDCKYYERGNVYKKWCWQYGRFNVEPDGFCAWGERLYTCKCGEELETEGVCPSCGRMVME